MDEGLVGRAQAGDETAFDRLVELHTPLVWRTAIVLLKDRALAEDATQEAWLDVWRALPTFRTDGSFRSWLLTIVANRCHKMVRRRVLPTLSLERAGTTLAEDLPSSDDTEAQALRQLADDELHSLLGTLGADQRTILELYAFADLTLMEIALITHTIPGTVKSRFHRALQTLRAYLRPDLVSRRAAEDTHE